jgi:sugar lactone lactonase YvrE
LKYQKGIIMKIAEPVVKIKAILGEGSIWDSNRQLLYWLDILGHQVFVYDPSTGTNTAIDVPDHPSTIVPRESGGTVITIKNGFASLDLTTGATVMLAEMEGDMGTNRFNDGKCDPAGRLWAGTMEFNLQTNEGSLYVLDRDLSVKKVLSDVTCSNGIVWTEDRKTMYYIDSPKRVVHAYDYDDHTCTLSNERIAVNIPEEIGLPDGMTIDSEGMIWVAIFGGSMVCRYDPKSGEKIDTVQVPKARCVTSCALGGPDLTDLYITTATALFEHKLDDPEMHENGGNLFKVKVDVPGIPAISFKG